MQKPKHAVSGLVSVCQLMKNGLARLILSKEKAHLLVLNSEKSMTIPPGMIRLVQIVWQTVVHRYQLNMESNCVVERVILWLETVRRESTDSMKWEPTSGNGFKGKAHKPEPEAVLGGMVPCSCTGNTPHSSQKIFMRFILALGVPQISKFQKIFIF